MKIESLQIKDYPPIKFLELNNLGNIVIIAGANGSGKTKLKDAIVTTLLGSPQMTLTLKATRDDEIQKFGGSSITINQGQNNQALNSYISSRQFGRGQYVGSLVQIDSERSIKTIKYKPIPHQVIDPDDTETQSNLYTQKFDSRWQTFMDDIHKKVAAYDSKLAKQIKNKPRLTGAEILNQFPHPLEKYKEIFKNILPGKELEDVNPVVPSEFQYRENGSTPIGFSTLSSGEQEVIKIVFDLIKKDIIMHPKI